MYKMYIKGLNSCLNLTNKLHIITETNKQTIELNSYLNTRDKAAAPVGIIGGNWTSELSLTPKY